MLWEYVTFNKMLRLTSFELVVNLLGHFTWIYILTSAEI